MEIRDTLNAVKLTPKSGRNAFRHEPKVGASEQFGHKCLPTVGLRQNVLNLTALGYIPLFSNHQIDTRKTLPHSDKIDRAYS